MWLCFDRMDVKICGDYSKGQSPGIKGGNTSPCELAVLHSKASHSLMSNLHKPPPHHFFDK